MTDFKEIKYEPRQDWNQTSSGVGHQYRPGYYFPSSHFHVNVYLSSFILNSTYELINSCDSVYIPLQRSMLKYQMDFYQNCCTQPLKKKKQCKNVSDMIQIDTGSMVAYSSD